MNSELKLGFQDKWCGWIPTNLGELQFEFITQEQNQQTFPIIAYYQSEDKNQIQITIDAKKISDSLKWRSFLVDDTEWEEIQAKTAKIELRNHDTSFEGNIALNFSEVEISTSFSISLNGLVEFTQIDYTQNKFLEQSIVDFHRLALYILLKSVVHGDNHHHQKIDVALKVTDGTFDPVIILHNLLIHIKSIERNIKRLKGCASKIEAFQAYHDLEGYISYCKSFYAIFIKDLDEKKEMKILYENLENIKNSAKAKIDKFDKQNTLKKNTYTTFMTLMALVVSISILTQTKDEKSLYLYLYFIPILLFLFIEGCALLHYLRLYRYDEYETLKHLRNIDTIKLNWRGEIIQKIIVLSPRILFLSALWYGLKIIFPSYMNDLFNIVVPFIAELFQYHFAISLYAGIIFIIFMIATFLGWKPNPVVK